MIYHHFFNCLLALIEIPLMNAVIETHYNNDCLTFAHKGYLTSFQCKPTYYRNIPRIFKQHQFS